MSNELIKVGKYDTKYNDILGIEISDHFIFKSKGFASHLLKRKHFDVLKYIDYVDDIIKNPDYIGINPNEKGQSVEFVKKFKDNIMLGVKVDSTNKYMYIATMHKITESTLDKYLNNKRLIKLTNM